MYTWRIVIFKMFRSTIVKALYAAILLASCVTGYKICETGFLDSSRQKAHKAFSTNREVFESFVECYRNTRISDEDKNQRLESLRAELMRRKIVSIRYYRGYILFGIERQPTEPEIEIGCCVDEGLRPSSILGLDSQIQVIYFCAFDSEWFCWQHGY